MRAFSLVRKDPHYRHEAFLKGLAAAGYEVHDRAPDRARPGDVLVTWNRYGHVEQICDRFEAEGGTVLVAENGYVKGRHDGGDYYALAIHGHNGSGRWNVGGPERWDALGVELKPWRTGGKHILVAPNRSFGMRGTVMPDRWGEQAAERLRKQTALPVRLRLHPGNNRPAVPLEDDLRDAWAVVIWSSSVGVKALIEGIRVVCEASYWICKDASASDLNVANWKCEAYRETAMRALAWAQWSISEIGSGDAFRYLLQPAGQSQVAASA